MKNTIRLLAVFLLVCGLLTGCYEIDTHDPADYPGFYREKRTDFEMLPAPDAIASIEDVYLFYSDYDLLDSYYTIYLACSFTPEQFEAEKQRLTDYAGQIDFSLTNADVFAYDSVYINQVVESSSDGFLAFLVSYALFDAENNRIIYVEAFEKGTNAQWKTAYIPDAYLPSDLLDLIK